MNYMTGLKALTVVIALTQLTACGNNRIRPQNSNLYIPAAPVAVPSKKIVNGSIYQISDSNSLFEDRKAKRVGDIITIVLTEKTNAIKKISTITKKENKTDFGGPTVFGKGVTLNGKNLLDMKIDPSNKFTGQGDSKQSNALTGTISVTVARVLSNGNLYVKGQKQITLNTGLEYIRISGIIRPDDIDVNNSVSSTQLADAIIVYSGEGSFSDSNKMGWLAKFFNSSYWPF